MEYIAEKQMMENTHETNIRKQLTLLSWGNALQHFGHSLMGSKGFEKMHDGKIW